MQRSISAMVGKGSVNHNSRKFLAANVDRERTHLNIEYCNKDIRETYHEPVRIAVSRTTMRRSAPESRKSRFTRSFCRSATATTPAQRQRLGR